MLLVLGVYQYFLFIVEMASVHEETDSDEYCSDEPSQADSNSSLQSLSKKRKVVYKQKFRHEWLQIKEFQGWLKPPSQGNSKPMCSVCACSISCAKTAIDRHRKSSAHIKLVKASQSQCSVVDSFHKQLQPSTYSMLTQSRICAFIAENNLSFSLSKPLVDLIKATSPTNTMERETLQQLKMSVTKCTNVIRQGLGYRFSRELVDRLKHTCFSIIPDETTDVGSEKQLAICVVFFDHEKYEVVTSFFDMVVVEKCDAENLYSAIKKCFEEKNIPLKNIIGFSSDTCNVMFGERQSVFALMKAEFPHISFVKCSCHMIHLCVSHACLKLSTTMEDLCRNVFSHFSRSSLRRHELEEFQAFLQITPHKMLAFGQTRWLSLEACVARLLEQWDALTLYFTALVSEKRDPSYVTETILKSLTNVFIKAQLQFLHVQLRRANEFNTLFQSTSPMLHCLHEKVQELLVALMSDFIQIKCVRNCDPFTLDIHNKSFHVPVNQIYTGIHATDTIQNSAVRKDEEGIKRFKLSCQAFLVELIDQIRSRFNTKPFKILTFLEPENALNLKPNSLREVFLAFPYMSEVCDCENADLEWRRLALDGLFSDVKDVSEFWKRQLSLKSINGDQKYPNLSKVVGCALALPHSNAAVERIFSQLRLIKSDMRNSMKSTSLVSLLHVKTGLHTVGISAHQLCMDDKLKKALKDVDSDATDAECQAILHDKFHK